MRDDLTDFLPHYMVHDISFVAVLQAKRKLKAERLQSELINGTLAKTGSDDSSEDEDKYADEIDMPGTKFDSKR